MFVEDLKGELESTYKEEISVYFDVDPHNGILETHDVDESLRDKLKCLIFIPVISKTYCDPKSFAWEHEFKAFIENASKDQFGLKVKLPNGNVANRVLPVQIHELGSADRSLLEDELGGVLRSVEFVYKEPGVNRPLTPGDKEEKNAGGTSYRNQINKVANAIDEILDSLVNPSSPVTEEAVPEQKTSAKKDHRRKSAGSIRDRSKAVSAKGRKVIFTFGTMVVLGAIFSLVVFTSGSSLPFEERDWIMMADFDNQTNEPVFDRALYTAFTISANQSRYVNILPRTKMREILQRMNEGEKSHIDEDTAREMAEREGIKLAIVPAISKLGNQYILSAKIVDAKTGEELRSELVYADNPDDILNRMDVLSKKIRKDLGESRFNISLQDKPLAKATTSSLDALKMYSLGIDNHLKMDFEKARDYYMEALRIDTGFVAAKASLGNILMEHFNKDKGKHYLEDAIRDIDRLTDRERLGILAFYDINVLGDVKKGIEDAAMRVHLYPDDAAARNNLGYYYTLKGDYENALEEYKQAIRIDRYQVITYGGIIWTYLTRLGNVDSSFVWADKMIKDNPENAWSYFYLGSAWICRDSIDSAATAFGKGWEISPRLSVNSYRLAHTYRMQGRYDEATDILKGILKYDDSEISAYYDLGINYSGMGNVPEAHKYFRKFLQVARSDWLKNWPDLPDTYISLSAVYARLGLIDSSDYMMKKAISLDSTIYRKVAEVYAIRGEIPEALGYIKKALDSGYRDLGWLKMDPEFQNLYYDTRYRDLLKKYFN